MPTPKRKSAGDPAASRMVAPDPALRVVEAAAVPVDQAALGHRDQIAIRSDTVLQRHGVTLAGSATRISVRRGRVSRTIGPGCSGRLARRVWRGEGGGLRVRPRRLLRGAA